MPNMAHVAQQSDYMPLNVIPRPTLPDRRSGPSSACRGICEAGRDYSPASTGKAGATAALPGTCGAKTVGRPKMLLPATTGGLGSYAPRADARPPAERWRLSCCADGCGMQLAWRHCPCRAEASTVQVAAPATNVIVTFGTSRWCWHAAWHGARSEAPIGLGCLWGAQRQFCWAGLQRERIASQWTSTMITTHLTNSEQLRVHTDNEISSHIPTKLGYYNACGGLPFLCILPSIDAYLQDA